MFTECSSCESVFKVSAENLRTAMGMVRCTHCSTVFNALTGLKDEHEVEASEVESLESQLPGREVGDKVLLDADFLQSQDWFVRAHESGRHREIEAVHAAAPEPEPEPAPEAAPESTEAEVAPDEVVAAAVAAKDEGPVSEPLIGRLMREMLGQTLTLAVRNLSRHARRTALGLGTIAFGVIALLLAGGFAEWMMWMERESTIHSRLGHVQIVKQGYFENGVADPYSYLIDETTVPVEAIAGTADVKAVTPRLSFSGLISKDETTVSFLGEGVAPETEKAVSEEIIVHAGDPLASDDPEGIILGKGLAASLGAAIGDTVVLLTTADGGMISAVEGHVRGIFHTAVKAFDDVALRTPLGLAQNLTRAEGAHQYIVLLDETEKTDSVLAALNELVPSAENGLELIPWIDLADFYKAVVDLFEAQTSFVRLVIAIIIVMTISNTLVMSVLERTSEIGTLMAVGFRRKNVMQLFISEGFVLGLAGGIFGTLVGVGLAHLISYIGIPMPPAPGMDHGFVAAIRVTTPLMIAGFIVAVVSAVLASIYPAWKASHLEIVDALRHAK